jgi:endonuclease YncB( thermonuclease family)
VTGEPEAQAGHVVGYADPDPWIGSTSPSRPNVLMVGDSITYRGRGTLLGKHRWEVSAVPGRNVETLPCYLADRLRSHAPLDVVIVALGTNATTWWTYEDYRDALTLLPRRTRVVFVTTYRDPVTYSDTAMPYRGRASVQETYSRWMRTIASWRPGTCVADWRGYVQAHPTAAPDGVHPAGASITAWAGLVGAAAAQPACLPEPMTSAARVLRVVDGDTVTVALPSGARQRVALAGVRHPAPRRCARAATGAARALLPAGHAVPLVPVSTRPDVPGADPQRYVVTPGNDVGRALVRRGLARVRAVEFGRRPAYLALERQARQHHRGLWGRC